MVEFILDALPGVIVAIIASTLAARWSLKKLYAEKWWERKERAYVEIIDALHNLIEYCEIQMHDYGDGTGYTDEQEAEFRDRYRQALRKIKKATDIGSFSISGEADAVLRDLRSRPKLDPGENPIQFLYEHDYEHYRKALEKIVPLAKKDLNARKA